jgi:hypothetical protein
MQVEIQRMPSVSPDFDRYHVRAGGVVMTQVEHDGESPELLAQILEAAVEGIIREGRPWMLKP